MAWDESAFDELRDEMGRAGVQEITLWPNKSPVKIDLSGMETLILMDRVSAPTITAAIEVAAAAALARGDDVDSDEDDTETPSDPATAAAMPPPEPEPDVWESARRITRWQDQICAAVFVDPPWCPIDEIPQGARPRGKLCIFDLSREQRRYIVDLAFQGVRALETFRTGSGGDDSALHGDGLRNDTSGSPTESGSPPTSEVVAERSDLAPSENGRALQPAAAGRRRAT